MSLLKVDHLNFAFGVVPVLSDICFELSPGQIMAILGPNGSGKSTLLRLILGTLRGAGSVKWNDREVGRWRSHDLAKLVAYLPQNPAYEPTQSVLDVLRLGRFPYLGALGTESTQDVQVIHQVAGDLQLAELLHRPMEDLSGGQRQRVFIGRCLVQQPGALLLDEPATFLDLRHQVELHQLLVHLAREKNLAVLMSSHDLNLAASHADRAMILKEGKTLASGAVADVLTEANLSVAFEIPMKRVEIEGRVMIVPVG